jgi:hypothetical protein
MGRFRTSAHLMQTTARLAAQGSRAIGGMMIDSNLGRGWRRAFSPLAAIALLCACGDDDDAAISRRDGGDAGEDGGLMGSDSGRPGSMDGGRKDGGPDAASSSLGEFSILGVTGPADDVADAWLNGGRAPEISWQPSRGAKGYEVTLYEEDGKTVKCDPIELEDASTSTSFKGCTLDEGVRYHASVIAVAGSARSPAENNGFGFAAMSLVIGRADAVSNGVEAGLSLPNDVVIVGTRLIVADQNNSRVLIWNELPSANEPADLVLGQPDLHTTQADYGGVGAATFRGSNGVASDGTRLIVADRFNHRVMIWNAFPTTSFEPADVVLGQPDFNTVTANTGGVSASSLDEPQVWLGGGKLFVSDRNNARVLIWNAIPSVSHAPADVVLGQPAMDVAVANNGGLGPSSIWDPGRGWVDGTRLFLPDIANHRVLIWNTIPTTNNAPADLVLGQPTMLTNGPNASGAAVGAAGLNMPISVYASGNTIAVADYGNNRVLLWNAALAASGQAADAVLGQPDAQSSMSNAGGAVGAATMASPNAVAGDAERLIVSDRFNQRLLFFTPIPSATATAASFALGQPDLSSNRINHPGAVGAESLAGPTGFARLGDRIAIADGDNSRVLIWDAAPSRGEPPAIVLGQPDFTSFGQFGGTASPISICNPWSVYSDGTRLAVGEQCARRVTIWNALPTSSQQAADLAVGQPDLISSMPNNGGVSARSLGARPQPHLDGEQLFVTDPNNHRVLIWNALPTASNAAADLVLGQPEMTSAIANNGGLSAASLSTPLFAYTSAGKLLVADSGNRRVLIWNAIPSASNAAADVVLGQPNMTSGAISAPSARDLGMPHSLHVDEQGRLYVVDSSNHRVLYWNAIPSENYAAADGVIGQPGFTTGLANDGGLNGHTLQNPSAVLALGDQLYIADTGNNRVLHLPRP